MEQNNKTLAEIIAQMKEKANSKSTDSPKTQEEVLELIKTRLKALKELKEKNGNNL